MYFLLIVFYHAFIWRKKRNEREIGYGTDGHGFDFVFLVIKGECTGSSPLAKDRVSCGIVIVFIWLPPWLERWSFIAS